MNWARLEFDNIAAVVEFMNEKLTSDQAARAKVVTTIPQKGPQPGYFFGISYTIIYPEPEGA